MTEVAPDAPAPATEQAPVAPTSPDRSPDPAAAPSRPSPAPAPVPAEASAPPAPPAPPVSPAPPTSADGEAASPLLPRAPATARATSPSSPASAHSGIFDLPDQATQGKAAGNGTIVLGGAAAAEGRTTGPNPRIAGPASSASRMAPAGEEAADATEERGRHFASPAGDEPRKWWPLALAAVPIVALVLLICGWAVDTAALSGQVMRNVEVAGRSVGGLGEASLPDVMSEIDAELAARPVAVTSGERVYETTAGDIGLSVDAEATAEAALDAGRSDSLVSRPVSWLRSFFSPRDVELELTVAQAQVILKMAELQGAEVVSARNPTIQLAEGGWVMVPGVAGEGIDPEQVAADLPAAALTDPTGPIEIEGERVAIEPEFSDEEAQELADRANALTADGITLTAGGVSHEVPAEQLRTWIAPSTENGKLDLVIVPEAVNAALPELFSDLQAEPVDASFDLQGGMPVVVPSQQGVTCCAAESADRVWQALTGEKTEVELEAVVTEPDLTTEEAEGLGITQAVGGNNAWRDGQPTTAGPGFTTYHAGGQPRVSNIHRMADLVRGALILPGETFSINEHVGPRTTEGGFVPAGAIREGEHVDEVGGGVSQFATTMFNAAYFAGLDIPVSQAHSEYFSRYPLGREATMGYPAPDLQVRNNTDYGVLIWTSYTDTSLTVTLYSTPHIKAAQTGISESTSGACRVVTTTRTRTYPNGTTEQDTFRATYRPGPGLPC